MPEKIDFKSWWDERYFSTEGIYRPLYNVYAKLHKAGADLDHIEALCQCLRLGDLLAKSALSQTKRKKKSPAPTIPLEEMKLGEALAFAAKVESLNKAIAKALDEIEEATIELRRLGNGSPLLLALDEFFLPHVFHSLWSRGKKVDIWGSFFLLIVTEYMRSACDKPRHRLVDELLRAVRKQFRARLALPPRTHNHSISLDGRSRAAVRIAELKKAHPNWVGVVAPINRCLDMNKNKTRKTIADHRENHHSDRPSALLRSIASEFSRRHVPIPAKVSSKLLPPKAR